ncbi:MAG: GNAT family N-acetyltransferase [Myxococcota bacterium]
MSIDEVRVVSAAAIGDLNRLEPLARAVFGEGRRAPQWFHRKLYRECVAADASVLLTRADDPRDDAGWVGYGLLGWPPSLAPVARTAGIGLIPGERGRGLGRRLVTALCDAARNGGATAIHIPAPPDRVSFYARCGLQAADPTVTLLSFGLHDDSRPHRVEDWQSPTPGPIVIEWLADAWQRTPAHARYTWRTNDGAHRFDVSIEGRAHVVQRWTAAPGADVLAGTEAWRRAVPSGAPALLQDLPAVSSITGSLETAGWARVQTTVMMRRSFMPTAE